ncbi:hypothetical protein J4573_02505 [Actinomadura barringtoniae]|uniref:Uncharacterized protein n=1 Tax=Actinomadura barringtoniae TaxID=1427535 RepID=A0A939PCH6_9ACTN|nr:hypothetical protein [Actinomadura barringtoniae]MBO2445951.1 hypothetical protein [Actinomadura barringtoniae]
MPPKAQQPQNRAQQQQKNPVAAGRPVTITAVVDPVAALAAWDLTGSVYMYDTNRTEGSTGFGTEELRTKVRQGERLLWNVIPLECETFVAIYGIDIDERFCEPRMQTYPGTDITFWTATVKQDITEPVRYRLQFLLGTVTKPFATEAYQALVDRGAPGAKEQ